MFGQQKLVLKKNNQKTVIMITEIFKSTYTVPGDQRESKGVHFWSG